MGILDTVGINGTDYEVADSSARSMIAPAYDSSKTYAVGDYVTYSGGLYRCETPITTAEAWTATHWKAVNVGGEVSGLRFSEELDSDGIGKATAYVNATTHILTSGGAGTTVLIQSTGAGVYKITKTAGDRFRHGYIKANDPLGSEIFDYVNDDTKTTVYMDVPADATYIIIVALSSGSSAGLTESVSVTKYTHAYDAEAKQALSEIRDIKNLPTDSESLVYTEGNITDSTLYIGGTTKSFYFKCRPNAKYIIKKTDTTSSNMMGAWLKKAPASGDSYYGKRTLNQGKQIIIETGEDAEYVFFTPGGSGSNKDTLRASLTIRQISKAVDYEARQEIDEIQLANSNEVTCVTRTNFLQTVGYDHEFFYDSIYFPTGYHMRLASDVSKNAKQYRETGVYINPTGEMINDSGYGWTLYNTHGRIVDRVTRQYAINRALSLSNCSCLAIGDSTIDQESSGVVKHMYDIFTEAGKTLTLLGTLDNTYPNEGRAGWALKDYVGQTARGRNEDAQATYTNPFWNATAEAFDFGYYMTEQGYSGVDYVVIQLGTNDMGDIDMADPYAYIQTMYGWLSEIMDSVLDYDSDIKIILNLPTTINSDVTLIGAAADIRFIQLAKRALYNSYVMEQSFKDYAWTSVRPSYCHLVLDPATDFNDSVHPNSGGYLKMAKEVVNQMNHFMNE